MGFFGKLLGTDKAIDRVGSIAEKTITGIGSWIDKRKFTDQERAEYSVKGLDMYIRINETLATENTIRSITRRYLALAIIGVFLMIIIFSIAIFRFDPEWSAFSLSTVKDTQLGLLVAGVGFIYFGSYAWSYLKKKDK